MSTFDAPPTQAGSPWAPVGPPPVGPPTADYPVAPPLGPEVGPPVGPPPGDYTGGPPPGWPPPPPGWQPPPPGWQPPPPPSSGPGGGSIILTLVAVVIAALIGATIGSHLFRSQGSAPTAVATFPTSPFGDQPSSTDSGLSAQAAAVANKVAPGLVDIDTTLGYQRAEAAGTGMVVSSAGEVVTNNHVIDGATSITATDIATGRTYTAKVVGADPTADVAVLQLQGASGLKTIPVAKSSNLSTGQAVVAIGNAGGVGGAPSVVTGVVSALNQTITASDNDGSNAEQLSGLIQTDAPIQPGDSGGPLVSSSGQVVGMDTAASTSARFEAVASEGFAIPIGEVLSVAGQIESGKATSTVQIGIPGFLGVAVETINQLAEGTTDQAPMATTATSGAAVAGVEPNSPASSAGLVAGDVIVSIDGEAVISPDGLSTIMHRYQPGDSVTIDWIDPSGASHHAKVALETGPAD